MSQRIGIFGGVLLDLTCRPDWSGSGEDRVATVSADLGGVGLNVARNLAWIGIESDFMSALRTGSMLTDAIASRLNELSDINVHIVGVGCIEEAIFLNFINEAGESAFATSSPLDNLSDGAQSELLENFHHFTDVIVDTNIPKPMFNKIGERAKNGKCNISVVSASDTKASSLKRFSELNIYSKFISFNEPELRMIGLNEKFESKDLSILGDFYAENLLITLGKDGAFLVDKRGYHEILPPKCQVIDATGAGDALFSATFACFLQKIDPVSDAGKSFINGIVERCLGRAGP
jgi:sugar/nucleoside kinase (ribokinase family)